MQTENNSNLNIPQLLNGTAHLQHCGIIQLEGDDASKFIHSQLTQDFSLLGLDHARLAAYCSAKGRMLASFIGYKDTLGNIFLICHKDLIQNTIKRLKMFVLRAKVNIQDVSGQFTLQGIAGDKEKVTGLESALPWSKTEKEGAVYIKLYPALGVARYLCISPTASVGASANTLSENLWIWSEVQSGVATLSSAVSDMFVPQMLNYESVQGINFKKGCYPGQEVVARSQFRGTIKRRAFIVHSPTPLNAGDLVYSATDPEQECATVVQSAPAPGGGFDAIISGQVTAIEQGDLHANSSSGPKLLVLTLGYKLLEDI